MRTHIIFLLGFLLMASPVLACPSSYDCITWGNIESMAKHDARNWTTINRTNCTDHANFTFDSDQKWYTLIINYLDNNKSKNSFQVFIDGKTVGIVDDLDGTSAFRSAMIYLGGRYSGKHTVELVTTDKTDCSAEKLVLNWAALNTNYTSPPGGGSRRPGGSEPSEVPKEQEIPEFGTIGLVLGLLGSLAVFGLLKRS